MADREAPSLWTASSVVWSPVSRGGQRLGPQRRLTHLQAEGLRERLTTGGVLPWAPVRPTQLSRLMAGAGGARADGCAPKEQKRTLRQAAAGSAHPEGR